MQNKKLFPDAIIITTQFFIVAQDWEVPIPGFFIIAPRRKIKAVDQLSDFEAAEFMHLVRHIRKGMRDILEIDEVYLFQNEDSRHGFHLWLFPRHARMEKIGIKIESVKPIMNYAQEHMCGEDATQEVMRYVKKMRNYMHNISSSQVQI